VTDISPEGPWQERLRQLVDAAVEQPYPLDEHLDAVLAQVRDCDPGAEHDVVFAFLEVHRLAAHVRRTAGPPATEPLFATIADLALDAYPRLRKPALVGGLARQLWAGGMGRLSLNLLDRASTLEVSPAEEGAPPPDAFLRNLHGEQLRQAGDAVAAEACFIGALAELSGGPFDIERSVVLNNLGLVSHEQGDLAGAAAYLTRALELSERAGGGRMAAVALDNLGALEMDLADGDDAHLAAADGYFDRAREEFENDLPGTAEDYVRSLVRAAEVAGRRGDPDKRDALSERALELAVEHEITPDTRWSVVDLRGTVLLDTGRAAEAVALMAQGYRELWPVMRPSERMPEGLTVLLRAAAAVGDQETVDGTGHTIASIDDRLAGRLDPERLAARTELVLGYCLPEAEGPAPEWVVELVLNRKDARDGQARVTVADVWAGLEADTLLLEFATMRRPSGERRYVVFQLGTDRPLRYRDLGPAVDEAALFGPEEKVPGHLVVAPVGDWAAVPFDRLFAGDHVVTVVTAAPPQAPPGNGY
jgi:tetratricopeptide (TPR) repeat protein